MTLFFCSRLWSHLFSRGLCSRTKKPHLILHAFPRDQDPFWRWTWVLVRYFLFSFYFLLLLQITILKKSFIFRQDNYRFGLFVREATCSHHLSRQSCPELERPHYEIPSPGQSRWSHRHCVFCQSPQSSSGCRYILPLFSCRRGPLPETRRFFTITTFLPHP